MNSNKQKKKYLKAKRKQRAEKLQYKKLEHLAYGQIKADPLKLTHVCSWCRNLPLYYENIMFVCRDCGSDEIWLAKQQKFYYEECKGHIDSRAVRCKPCRIKINRTKKQQRAHMLEMENIEMTSNEMFFKDLEAFKRKRA